MSKNFVNDFFSDIFSNTWHRPLLESKGLVAIKSKNGIVIMANVAGVNPEDVKVQLSGSVITIKGETKAPEILGDYTFKVDYSRGFFERTLNKIDNIDYEIKNGYVYVYLNFKEPVEKEIPIKRLK